MTVSLQRTPWVTNIHVVCLCCEDILGCRVALVLDFIVQGVAAGPMAASVRECVHLRMQGESHVRFNACKRLRLGEDVTELERRTDGGPSAAGVYDGTEYDTGW
jgi:hypothetical protein